MDISIKIDSDALAECIANLSQDEAFDLIKKIDDNIAEYDFTQKLMGHFKDVLDYNDCEDEEETENDEDDEPHEDENEITQ